MSGLPYPAGTAAALLAMGRDPLTDFRVADNGDGTTRVVGWFSAEPQPTPEQIAAALLPSAQARRIAEINAECRARLIARFGAAEEQVSRAIGVYGAAEQTALENGIAATIDASNTASNAILAATTTAAAEAVTVAWPVI